MLRSEITREQPIEYSVVESEISVACRGEKIYRLTQNVVTHYYKPTCYVLNVCGLTFNFKEVELLERSSHGTSSRENNVNKHNVLSLFSWGNQFLSEKRIFSKNVCSIRVRYISFVCVSKILNGLWVDNKIGKWANVTQFFSKIHVSRILRKDRTHHHTITGSRSGL